MVYVLMLVIGLVLGAVIVGLVVLELYRRTKSQKTEQDALAQKLQETHQKNKSKKDELNQWESTLRQQEEGFENRSIKYQELLDENTLLKRDLHNIDVNQRKLQLDIEQQREIQEKLDQQSTDLGIIYLKENVKWISPSLTTNNFAMCSQRLQTVIKRCRGIGFEITQQKEEGLIADLKSEYKTTVRDAFKREEQARIKAQIREEQKLEQEIEREMKQLDRERIAIEAALKKAIAEATDGHSEEVERLKKRLAEAEEKSRRAISQAQLTRSGHVYVISNIGAFGDGVYKIGMTRRLEPVHRVKELSSASVPFPFDIHMMISCDDAPTLENQLHHELHNCRLNKVNPRKEYFRSDIETIRQIVERNHGTVEYVAEPEALEYHQSSEMSDEDYEFIERVYDDLDEESESLIEE